MASAGMVVGLLGLLVPTSVAADSPFLTVTPAADLVDGEVITIQGNSGDSATSGIGQCPTADVYTTLIQALNGCSAIAALGGPSYAQTYPVRRVIVSNGRTVDCAVESCSIRLLGGDGSFNVTLDLGVPLDFAPADAFTTVNPESALGDQHSVSVAYSGGEEGVPTVAVQCVRPAPELSPDEAPNRCIDLAAMAGPLPVVEATVTAERWMIDGDGVERDCAIDQCLIGAAHGTEPLDYVLREVDFTTRVRVGFSPPTGTLAGGDIVAVTATNVDKRTFNRTMQQCAVVVEPDFSITTLGCDPTDAGSDNGEHSTYDGSFTVERFLTFGSTTYDCTKSDGYVCSFRLIGYDGPGSAATASMVTDSVALLAFIPELDVTPRFGLPRVSDVAIVVDAPSAHDGFIGVCPSIITPLTFDIASQWCDGGPVSPHGPGAEFTQTVTRGYESEMGHVDCAFLGCDIVYLAGPDDTFLPDVRHRRSLSFGRSIAFDVGTFAIADQPFEIDAVGYRGGPGFTAVAMQCGFLGVINFENFHCQHVGPTETDFDGDYSSEVSLDRYIATDDGTIDCGAAFCGVILAVQGPDGSVIHSPGQAVWVLSEPPF